MNRLRKNKRSINQKKNNEGKKNRDVVFTGKNAKSRILMGFNDNISNRCGIVDVLLWIFRWSFVFVFRIFFLLFSFFLFRIYIRRFKRKRILGYFYSYKKNHRDFKKEKICTHSIASQFSRSTLTSHPNNSHRACLYTLIYIYIQLQSNDATPMKNELFII